MIVLSNHQHSVDWWDARQGKVTGSMVADILSFLKRGDKKGGESASRAAYKIKLVTEILTGAPVMDGYMSPEMQWGVDTEILARAAYEVKTAQEVDLNGFVLHDEIGRFGGSPDGYVGTDGLIEIKCPKTTTHVKWMLAGVVPEEHEPQMSAYLSITGRAYADFVSFDPRLPERYQLFVVRLQRSEERIQEIEAGVRLFLAEVDALLEKLQQMNPKPQEKLRQQLQDSLTVTDEDIGWWYKQ